nr:DUF3108 domain-containing protein [uncultured Glaciecola sp.]
MRVTKMLKVISVILFALACKVSLAEDASELPSPFVAQYDAFRHDRNIGTAELSLKPISAELYELKYSSKVSRFFLSDKRYETTVFSFIDGKITPITYDFKRKGTGPNKSLNAKFDAKSQTIILSEHENLTWEGEFDNQLFRIDISRQLALNRTQFEYKFLNYRGQKRDYKIEVVKKEILTLPYGNIEAVKVRVNRDSSKRQTYAWFAPSLDYVLVRLQQFKDDEEQGDIRLNTYQKF